MKHAILTYETAKGKTKSLKVQPGQFLLIGSSNSADIKLADPAGVSSQHCEVKFKRGIFKIKVLSKGKRSIRINGGKVRSSELADGDCIEIGRNKLTVSLNPKQKIDAGVSPANVFASVGSPAIEKTPSSEPSARALGKMDSRASTKQDQPKKVAAKQASESDPVFTDCGNGIQTFTLVDFKTVVHPLFMQRADHWHYGVFLNHLASGLKQAPPQQANLLADSPPEIGSSNDLYFESSEDMNAVLDRFTMYAEKKSAILALMKNCDPKVDYPGEFKLLATWFMDPDLLKFNLTNGTQLLISKIFSFLDILVISDPDAHKDVILLNDPTVGDWDSFVMRIKEYTYVAGR